MANKHNRISVGLVLSAGVVLIACGGTLAPGANDSGPHDSGAANQTDGVACVPSLEVCDGVDNDCNGKVDDNILDDPRCADVTRTGTADEDLIKIAADDPDNPTDRAGITLSRNVERMRYLWAANHTAESVTKFDTQTHEEVGQYWVGLNPSRTAVDLLGDAWIGGRDDGRLTHILHDVSQCSDRNGNGQVDTSRAQAGKASQINSAANPLADECVVYNDVPNSNRLSIRGLAAGPDGRVWIGYTEGGIQSIDPLTHQLGSFISDEQLPVFEANASGVLVDSGEKADGGGVYGMVVDSSGRLYISSNGDRHNLVVFDTVSGKWIGIYRRLAPCSYGIAIDGHDRVWTGGYPECAGVTMFDPKQLKFTTFGTPAGDSFKHGATAKVVLVAGGDKAGTMLENGNGGFYAKESTTGVAVEPPTAEMSNGDVWASFYNLGFTGRLRVNEQDFAQSEWTFIGTIKQDGENLPGMDSNDLRGIGFDASGFAWTLGLCSDRVFKIDPATNERHTSLPTGKSIGVGPHYTYSDFTGSTALSFTAPRGVWRHSVQYDSNCTIADSIDWEAYVPEGTSVSARIRAIGEGNNWVPSSTEYFQYPPGAASHSVDLSPYADQLQGTRFELEVRLSSDPASNARPILHSVNVPPTLCVN